MHKCTISPSLTIFNFDFLCPVFYVLKQPPFHHHPISSVGAKQSQQWLDPGTYERSSLISLGQEQHKGSNQRHNTNSTRDEASTVFFLCVCDVVLFLWPVKLSSWKKKKKIKPLKVFFFTLFHVLWFSLVHRWNSWKHTSSASPSLCNQGEQQSD